MLAQRSVDVRLCFKLDCLRPHFSKLSGCRCPPQLDSDVSEEARGITPDEVRSPRAHGGSAAPWPGDLGGRCVVGRCGQVLPGRPPPTAPSVRPATRDIGALTGSASLR